MKRLTNIPILFVLFVSVVVLFASLRTTDVGSLSRTLGVAVGALTLLATIIYYGLGKPGISFLWALYLIGIPAGLIHSILSRPPLEQVGLWIFGVVTWPGMLMWAGDVERRLALKG